MCSTMRRRWLGRQLAPVAEERGEVTACEATHDEIRAVGLAPVVVHRHHLRMFQPRDALRLGLEPADEVGVVGEVGADDLDRHQASDRRLVRREHLAGGARTDQLAQLVPAHRETAGCAGTHHSGVTRLQRGIVTGHATFELDDRLRRIEADLVGQIGPIGGERSQGLALPPRLVQREHQLTREPFAPRMLTDQTLQLGYDVATATGGEVGVDPVLHRGDPQLGEPGDLGLGERVVGELLVGVPAPERERLAQDERRRGRVGIRQPAPLVHQRLETHRVDVVGLDHQHVAGRARDQDRSVGALRSIGFEQTAQPRDDDPQRVLTIQAGVVPQLVDDPVGRHDTVGLAEQQRQQGAPPAAEVERFALPDDADLSQHPVFQLSGLRRSCSVGGPLVVIGHVGTSPSATFHRLSRPKHAPRHRRSASVSAMKAR